MGFDETMFKILELILKTMKYTPLVSTCYNCEYCEYVNYDGTVKCIKYIYTDAKMKCPYYKPKEPTAGRD